MTSEGFPVSVGGAVWLKPRRGRERCGIVEGLARVVSLRGAIASSMVQCEQAGVPVWVRLDEIVGACGVLDGATGADPVPMRFCPRCHRYCEGGKPCPVCGLRKWTDTLPRLGGGAS